MNGNSTDLVNLPTVSVVIATYSMDRWHGLCEAIASARAQTIPVLDIVVVVDYNPRMMAKVISEFPGITVIANSNAQGASGGRNSGAAVSRGEVLAFLDDDVVASPNWLEALLPHLKDPAVVGVGGRLEPLWNTSRPRWFPEEFYWVIGCSYRGMPQSATVVRNVWSGNMAIRRSAFNAVGGFRDGFGKIGARSQPEDTDLCLRTSVESNGGIWIYEPNSIAGHRVPTERMTLGYFLRRCYWEGQGKAALTSLGDTGKSLSTERQYTRSVLPNAISRGLRETARGEVSGTTRSVAILTGLTVTVAGFLADRIIARRGATL